MKQTLFNYSAILGLFVYINLLSSHNNSERKEL